MPTLPQNRVTLVRSDGAERDFEMGDPAIAEWAQGQELRVIRMSMGDVAVAQREHAKAPAYAFGGPGEA